MDQEDTADPHVQEHAAEPDADIVMPASSRTEKVFHVVGLVLVVVSAPGVVVNWRILIEKIMREMDKAPDALNSQHFLLALWGDLAFLFNGGLASTIGAFWRGHDRYCVR